MIYTLSQLIDIGCSVGIKSKIHGKWIPARPMRGGLILRAKAAWLVLTDKADAVIWPEGQ